MSNVPVSVGEKRRSIQPYVPDQVVLPEFTWSAVLVGAVLGIIFGASSLYLVLKVGMTVSASIPVAVLSITLFRVFSRVFGVRRATILENNIVQTTGSAGESIAFGVGVTMPAVMLLGFEMDIARIMVVSVLGGLLGILMMIPLRRAFIVKQHGKLIYPEGTACADVLIIGETGGATAKTVFVGFGLAFVYKFLSMRPETVEGHDRQPLDWFKGATPAWRPTPRCLGVGYIIGTRISCIMVAGGILSWFVLVSDHRVLRRRPGRTLDPDETDPQHDADDRNYYVLYIGAGAVAAGGIISMIRAMPLILASIVAGLRDLRPAGGNAGEAIPPHRPRFVRCASCCSARWRWWRYLDIPGRRSAGRRQLVAVGHLQLGQLAGRRVDRAFRLPVRHGFLAFDRRNRLLVAIRFPA